MIINAFILALRQIKRNFLRAFLTMLGVIIGVGAVIVMISLGNGTTQMISDRISSLGSNLLLVFPARAMNPSGVNLRRNFSMQEAQNVQMLSQEYIEALAPISQTSVMLQYQSQNTTTQAQGVDPECMYDWRICAKKSFFSKQSFGTKDSLKQYCV